MSSVLIDSYGVSRLAGIPRRTLLSWVETGLLRPAVYTGRRRTPVGFSQKDVKEAIRLARLREYLPVQLLRKVINRLRSMGHNPLSTGEFLVIQPARGRRELLKICDVKEARQLLRLSGPEERGQLVLIPLSVDEVAAGVRAGEQLLLLKV